MPLIVAESPEFLNLFFATSKQRPTEARFVACKKRFKNEDLKRKAGFWPKKLKRKNFYFPFKKTEQSLIFAVWEERRQIRLFLRM